MKKILKKKSLLILGIFALICCSDQKTGRVFYMDSENGKDNNLGTSKSAPWKTLSRLNDVIFMPGDKVLFRSGSNFNGQFEPKGSGNKESPIIVDKYGDGNDPILKGNGEKQQTLLLENIEYWEINNLEITNYGENPKAGRNAITLLAWDYGEMNHIYLRNLTIRDVNGSTVKSEGGGNGIYWNCGGDSIRSRFIDLVIEDCHIYRCQRNGITGNGNSNRDNWFPSLGVIIRGNLIEEVPGDGIVPIACDGALVEKNIVQKGTDLLEMKDAAAGIWPWGSDNTLIQFNTVSGHKAKWDAQGFDSDYNCNNTIIQYNLSHDNYGGMLLVCNEGGSLGKPYNWGTNNTVVKGNISINDGIRPYPTRPGWFSPIIHISGPTKNTSIEDNIIIIFPKDTDKVDRSIVIMDDWGNSWPENTTFSNNVFYVLNDNFDYKFSLGKGINTQFKGNLFYGNFVSLPDDTEMKTDKLDLFSLPFHPNFPESLRKKVIDRLQQK